MTTFDQLANGSHVDKYTGPDLVGTDVVLYVNLVILDSYPHSNYQLVDKYLCKSRKKPPNLDQKSVPNRGMRETVCIPFIYLSLRKRETPNPLQLPPD